MNIDFNTQVAGFDLETQGSLPEYALQPFRACSGAAWVSAVAWTFGEKSVGQLYPKTDLIRRSLEQILAQDLYICGWNVAFDAAFLVALGLEDLVFRLKWLDSMLLWKHWVVAPEGDEVPAAKRKSYKLEAAMHEFFPDEAGFKDFTNFQTRDPEELKLLLFRCKEDTRFAVRLGEMFWSHLTPQQRRAALIEAQSIPQVAKTHVLGIKSSKEKALALKDQLLKDGDKARAALLEANPGMGFVESGLTAKQLRTLQAENPETNFVNLGSPKQLATLLYDTWGLPIQGVSKKTQAPSTDKYALYELAFIDPRAKLLKDVREAKGNCTKYAEGTLKSLAYNGDGCVRPGARIFSTYSSRMTYSSSQKRKGDKDLGTNNEEFPTGIALHQWKRGKDFRRLIRPPEGYTLVELDFAGQEFGWMAVASGDETMLSLREPGEDAHSYMGAQIAGIDYRTLIQRVAADDAEANLQRKLGKFCVAEGELVLTDCGLVAIEKVSLDMRVWDGVEFVAHTGSVYQGEKETITYAGLTATLDHMVYLEDGSWCQFGQAAAAGSRLAQTGDGKFAIRVPEDRLAEFDARRESPEGRLSLHEMRQRLMGEQGQPEIWEGYAVQGVRNPDAAYQRGSRDDQQRGSSPSAEAVQRDEAAVREHQRPVVQELRRAWDSVQIQDGSGGDSLRSEGVTTSNVPEAGHRPERERWPLRAGELEAFDESGEFTEQAWKQVPGVQRQADTQKACVSRTPDNAPGSQVCGDRSSESRLKGADSGSNSGAMVCSKLQTKRVYDITNAGPRNRFTVSNYLISNSNLSFQYRIGSKSATKKARVDYELDIQEEAVKQFLATYKATFVKVSGGPNGGRGACNSGYWQTQIAKCRQLGYAETFAGRRVQLLGSWAGRDAWEMESSAINYPIQGTGGDQKYLALAVARNLLPKFNGYFYFELHDGLFFIFPHAVARQAAETFKHVLSNLPYKKAWGVDLPITFPVDAKLSPESWGDLKSL